MEAVYNEVKLLIATATATDLAQREKHRAFDEIVRRYQDLAYGYAYAVLGDFQLAEDAAQEAFLTAWRSLDQLRHPEAFPGWLKRIVLTQCSRLTRGKQLDFVPLDEALALPAPGPDPYLAAEQSELRERVAAAVQALPENERLVTTLFYISEYTLKEIGAFLELPVTTIKKRLWSARQKLRHTMLDIVKQTLQERRPSRDGRFADTVALFNEALESLVAKLKQDRYILAAMLYGSLSHDQVWEKSDIDLLLIGREEKKASKEFFLVENGINIHATLVSRSRFKAMIEGQLQSSIMHSAFSKSTLLFSHDESIRSWYENVHHVGERDKELQLMQAAVGVVYTLAKAEKWFYVKKDVPYTFLWTLNCVNNLARIETLMHNEVTAREVIHQALRHNPVFFQAVYTDLIYGPKDEPAIAAALERIENYLEERLYTLFRPILQFLEEEGGIRSTTDLDAYFGPQVQERTLAGAYEWLAERGVIQKVSAPILLHEKSRVFMDEAAYYYDGGDAA
jgi:RNA polymerase sigma factor (sigma-70 family)